MTILESEIYHVGMAVNNECQNSQPAMKRRLHHGSSDIVSTLRGHCIISTRQTHHLQLFTCRYLQRMIDINGTCSIVTTTNASSSPINYADRTPVRRAAVTSTYPSDLSRLTNIESLRQGRGRGCILLLQLHLPGSSTRFHYRLSL